MLSQAFFNFYELCITVLPRQDLRGVYPAMRGFDTTVPRRRDLRGVYPAMRGFDKTA